MRYLITFSYDGSNFSGYQKQNEKRTVQNEIENKLSKILNKETKISGSGRTDSKVHALNQKAHFDTSNKMPKEKIMYALNKLLERDIYIKNIETVEENFHARLSIKKKTYQYLINTKEYNVFQRNYVYQLNQNLNIEKMKDGALYLIGEHDFTSFSKTDLTKEDMIRTIYEVAFEEKENLTITITGNGFLRYMVRNIVGALIDIGLEKEKPIYIKELLNKKDRRFGSKTASPVGLYLKDVNY